MFSIYFSGNMNLVLCFRRFNIEEFHCLSRSKIWKVIQFINKCCDNIKRYIFCNSKSLYNFFDNILSIKIILAILTNNISIF